MDVRCEKCLTEYELDEARLKPTGVTVKCTNCGHMFKIRKRSTTNVGSPDRAPTNQPRPQTSSGMSDPMAAPPDGSERVWMIRLETGETKTCRELATLQQWIVAGVVTRESLISRTGKTWKRLGDITELGSYFAIADEARGQRQQRASDRAVGAGHKPVAPATATLLGVGLGPKGPEDVVSQPALPTPAPDTSITPTSARTPPMGSGMQSPRTPTVRPADSARITSPEAVAATTVMPDDLPTPARPLSPMSAPPPVAIVGGHVLPDRPPPTPSRPMKPTPPPPPPGRGLAGSAPPGDRSTGAWVASAIKDISDKHTAPQGPSGGRVTQGTSPDAGFGGQVRPMGKDTGGFGGEVYDPDATGPVSIPSSGGLGKWIALGALAVIAAASILIFYVLRKDKSGGGAAATTTDAGTTVIAIADGAPGPTPDAATAAVAPGDALGEARTALYADVRDRESAAELALANRGEDAEVLAMRARLSTGIAQALEDEARLTADKPAADALRKKKDTTVLDAIKLASRAVQKAPTSVLANAAMADLLRLQGKPTKDVKKYLDAAGPAGAADREIALVGAMLQLRDKHLPEARTQLAKLDAAPGQPGSMEQTGDVRPRFQLALLASADGKPEDARTAVESILVVQPDHAGAAALKAKLASAVATTDPMPPEDGSNGGGSGSGKVSNGQTGGNNGGTSSGGGDDQNFERVLAKANAAAENSCAQAMPLYNHALDLKPNSVEALTGVGYCHLDAKEFNAAYSKFRAALMISPRYERALWGVAEMYQQQGKADKAIENYCKYLEVYPTNQAAQRQLEHLGGNCNKTDDGGGGGGGGGGGSGSATPPAGGGGDTPSGGSAAEPTPTPTPTPSP